MVATDAGAGIVATTDPFDPFGVAAAAGLAACSAGSEVESNSGEFVVNTTSLFEIKPDEKYAFQLSVTEFGSSNQEDRISSTSQPFGPIACSRITSLTSQRYPGPFNKPRFQG